MKVYLERQCGFATRLSGFVEVNCLRLLKVKRIVLTIV
jgi:hypothetical protein